LATSEQESCGQTNLSYEEALAFWYGRVNFEQRTPQRDDLKLEQMRTLLAQLGNPERRLRILHVAGSKGKGSTCAMLEAILRQAGYRTGLFTSPHLCRIEERVQVDGQPITREELVTLLGRIRAAVEPAAPSRNGFSSPRCSPTFFEVATAVGFLHFVQRRVDVAVIEVGLGGRLDSTNVCQPEVALITSISFDHTRQLGNRLSNIAREKAGIVKPGRPVISGATVPEARAVIEEVCRQRGSPLHQLGKDFQFGYEYGWHALRYSEGPGGDSTHFGPQGVPPNQLPQAGAPNPVPQSVPPRVQVVTRQRVWPWLRLGLLGQHQAANAAIAVACVEQLREQGWQIADSAVAYGLANVSWPARLEVIGQQPLVVLDCAHNVASAEALADTLHRSFSRPRRLLVFASSNDKDVAGMFRVLAPHFAHSFLTQYGNNPRSVPPPALAELWRQATSRPCAICPSAREAWQAARELAGCDDLICITGSVFLAGELRPMLTETG
jgi:dihydrofolate synthase/folylpolyglutamate synthase